MFDMNSGYSGYSMSNRAVEAYASGEKPLSKWSKWDIIAQIKKQYPDIAQTYDFKKVSLKKLRSLLEYTSWHHCSSYCNKIDFYSLGDLSEFKEADYLKLLKKEEKEEKEEVKEVKARCIYLEWSGTRKHPKATEIEAVGIIKGNWFFPNDRNFKKSTTANGFKILEILEK